MVYAWVHIFMQIKINKKMQTAQQNPNTRPIGKRVKSQRSNLGNPTDRCKIHRETYRDYLYTKLNFSEGTVEKLINMHIAFINRETIDQLWPLPMTMFHSQFIKKLQSL
jgi:hypothetical protein